VHGRLVRGHAVRAPSLGHRLHVVGGDAGALRDRPVDVPLVLLVPAARLRRIAVPRAAAAPRQVLAGFCSGEGSQLRSSGTKGRNRTPRSGR
jgi:hypothetical protein